MKKVSLITLFVSLFIGFVSFNNKLDVSGKYKTDFGGLILKQTGNKVTGTYSYPSKTGDVKGKLNGELKAMSLAFNWEQIQDTKKIGGTGTFIFSTDGKSFKGTWKDGAGKTGTWEGSK